jgi:protein SCO1/2
MTRLTTRRGGEWFALLVLLILLALATIGCARRDTPRPASVTRIEAPSAESFSVYDLPGGWRDQSGAERSLATLRGTPVLLAMVYTHCTATCPLAVSELKRIAASDATTRFVLVSLDPARDDPAQLAAFARGLELDPARWTLLTGSDGDVRELAATLGVRYRQVTPQDLSHSNLITLLDRDGRIVRQSSGRVDDGAIAALR